MDTAAFATATRTAIIARMRAEEADDTSDAEITRTLSECVAGRRLVKAAKWLRERGLLDLS